MTIVAMVLAAAAAMAMSPFQAIISDPNGPATNLRMSPKGKIAMSLPTYNTYVVNIANPTNGWWEVDYIYDPIDDRPIKLHGSTTGRYWIHSSVLGLSTRNYGGQRWCLRSKPQYNAKATYYFNNEIVLRPIDISRDGDWVKVTTYDRKKSGWIENEKLCDNPVSTCP